MTEWVLLGQIYCMSYIISNATPQLKQEALNQFLGMIVPSATFAIAFFYFASAFIGMYGLLK